MICEKFNSLSSKERIEFIGSVVHAVQTNDELFRLGEMIIGLGKEHGVFDNVIINPSAEDIKDGFS